MTTYDTDPRVQALVSKLLYWARTANELSESRAALAELRHALPERERLRAAPFVAPFLGNTPQENEKWFYLVACLFATHRNYKAGQSLGHAFRAIKDKSGGMETRFLHLLSADPRRLPDLLRPAVALLAAHDVPLDWYCLLDDALHWNARDKPRQHKLARDFYFDGNHSDANNSPSQDDNQLQDDDTKGTSDAPQD